MNPSHRRRLMLAGALMVWAQTGCMAASQTRARLKPAPATNAPQAIGVATQEADGTIVLTLRASGPGGVTGDGLLRYPPDHPNYAQVKAHVGPIAKGKEVMVRPFP